MPPGKTSGGKPPKRPIERYEHSDKKRINNPPVGLVTPETDPVAPTHKTYDHVAPVPSVKPRQGMAASRNSHDGFSGDASVLRCQRNISAQSEMRPQNLLERVTRWPMFGCY